MDTGNEFFVTSRFRLQRSPKDERFIIAIPFFENLIGLETADDTKSHGGALVRTPDPDFILVHRFSL